MNYLPALQTRARVVSTRWLRNSSPHTAHAHTRAHTHPTRTGHAHAHAHAHTHTQPHMATPLAHTRERHSFGDIRGSSPSTPVCRSKTFSLFQCMGGGRRRPALGGSNNTFVRVPSSALVLVCRSQFSCAAVRLRWWTQRSTLPRLLPLPRRLQGERQVGSKPGGGAGGATLSLPRRQSWGARRQMAAW